MNLSPQWTPVLEEAGWEVVHWSEAGDARATDSTIMEYARAQGYIVFTHDLDFGTLLACTGAKGPSVFQVRTHDILPSSIGDLVVRMVKRYESFLARGALVVVDETRARVRILPIRHEDDSPENS